MTSPDFRLGQVFWNRREDQVWHLTNRLVDYDTDEVRYRLQCADHIGERFVHEGTLDGERSEYVTLPLVIDTSSKPRQWRLRDIPEGHKERYRDRFEQEAEP